MQLIGPWFSGPTRRVGVTLKLLGIPFTHLALHAYLQADAVRGHSPMGKVPALVLDDGTTLFNSWSIIDYLHEHVGASQALMAPNGLQRRLTLQQVGIADAIYGKLGNLYDESLRPAQSRQSDLVAHWTQQTLTGFSMLEAQANDGWMVGGKLSQSDIFVVIVYQTAARALLPDLVNADAFPKLAALEQRAMDVPAFRETFPFISG